MDLIHRGTEERDIEACFEILEDRFSYNDDLRARLPSVAARLLADGALNSAVLEDLDQPVGQRLVQFGASVFVTDQFMREADAEMMPHVSARVVADIARGRSPVLSLAEIREANSGGGLNLLVLHFGLSAHRWSEQEFPQVRARMPESFFSLHQGYNLKAILMEYCDERVVRFACEAGFRLRTDYAEFYHRHRLPLPPPGRRPQRLGITRSEAAAEPGTDIGRIFPCQRPRFFFAQGEQQLLLRALQGETDEEMAAMLHIALPTVKTRWHAIYDRVEARTPDLLPKIGVSQNTRGGEKRRLLLNYLRQHLEELRPARENRAK